ncbi:MAG: metalloregulator ArsR/SmtB family transcription factor [Trueperaceae bacterium]
MNYESGRRLKDSLLEQFARIPKALSSPRRLELIDLLAQGERSVEELAREASMSVANTSQHLQTLKAARLVTVRREGLYAFYRLASPSVFTLWQGVRGVGEEQLGDIDRLIRDYTGDRGALERISMIELKARLAEEELFLLDVRPEAEYRAGHIRGARSVPISDLEKQLSSLPKNREIVAYCRGPYCLFADEAVALLRTHGFRSRRLIEGFPDWRAAGLPVNR